MSNNDDPGVGALQLNISQIVLEEAPIEHHPNDQVTEQYIRAWLHFQLSGTAAEQVTAGETNCFIQLLAYEISTARTTVLAAERQQLRRGQQHYTTPITFAMLALGRYLLVGMVLVPDASAVQVAIGPSFRVMP